MSRKIKVKLEGFPVDKKTSEFSIPEGTLMKTIQALVALSLLLSYSCAQKSQLKGATASANIEKPEPEPVPDPVPVTDEEEIPVQPEPQGEPVSKVGINFEDNVKASGGRPDFNDAVLCFEGKFKVNKETREILSAEDQTITPSTFAAGQCKHHLKISIVSGGSVSNTESVVPNRTYGSEGMPQLVFKKGDSLEVEMIPDNPSCADGLERKHIEKDFSEVDYDTCNNTGN